MYKKITAGNRALIICTALLLLVGSISLTLFPAPCFSPQENRYLAQFPTCSTKELVSGRFATALNTYATERFPARLSMRSAYSLLQILEGRCEASGVLLCTDGSLARRIAVHERAYASNLRTLQALYAQYGDRLTVSIAPRRIDARQEVLPALYDTSADRTVWEILQNALPAAVTFTDLCADEQWYRTDHHWSTAGAFAAYRILGKSLGYVPFSAEDFEVQAVSTTFYGSSHVAAALPFVQPDQIRLFRYSADTALTVTRDGRNTDFSGLYDLAKLSERDQYSVFLGGNCGTLTVTAHSPRERLLVIKDSFANALLPFLAHHFDLIAIDPRYSTQELAPLCADCPRVLVLCGMQTLCSAPFFRS